MERKFEVIYEIMIALLVMVIISSQFIDNGVIETIYNCNNFIASHLRQQHRVPIPNYNYLDL